MAGTINAASIVVNARAAGFKATNEEVARLKQILKATAKDTQGFATDTALLGKVLDSGAIDMQQFAAANAQLRKEYGLLSGDQQRAKERQEAMNAAIERNTQIQKANIGVANERLKMMQGKFNAQNDAEAAAVTERKAKAARDLANATAQGEAIARRYMTTQQQVNEAHRFAKQMLDNQVWSFKTYIRYLEEETKAVYKSANANKQLAADREKAAKAQKTAISSGEWKTAAGNALSFGGGGQLASVAQLGKLAGAAAAVAIITKESLQAAAGMQRLQVTTEAFSGSAEVAKGLIADMVATSQKLPISLSAMKDGAQNLLAYGVEAEKVMDIMKRLGDITAGDTERFKHLSFVVAQSASTQRLTGDDLRQYVAAGWNPLKGIADELGWSYAKARKEMELGNISFQMVYEQMVKTTEAGGRHNDLLEKQAETMSGSWRIAMSEGYGVLLKIGDGFSAIATIAGKATGGIFHGINNLLKAAGEGKEWVLDAIGNKYIKLQENIDRVRTEQDRFNESLHQQATAARDVRGPIEQYVDVLERMFLVLEDNATKGRNKTRLIESILALNPNNPDVLDRLGITDDFDKDLARLERNILRLSNPALANYFDLKEKFYSPAQIAKLEELQKEEARMTKFQKDKEESEKRILDAKEKAADKAQDEMDRLKKLSEDMAAEQDPMKQLVKALTDIQMMQDMGMLTKKQAEIERNRAAAENQPAAMWPQLIKAGSSEAIKQAQEMRFKERMEIQNEAKKQAAQAKAQLEATNKTNQLLEDIKNKPQTLGQIP